MNNAPHKKNLKFSDLTKIALSRSNDVVHYVVKHSHFHCEKTRAKGFVVKQGLGFNYGIDKCSKIETITIFNIPIVIDLKIGMGKFQDLVEKRRGEFNFDPFHFSGEGVGKIDRWNPVGVESFN
ncbi:hypothetical protein U1Q18_052757 [Sarracenia purpurea var. burkii]